LRNDLLIAIPGGGKNGASRLIGSVTTDTFAAIPREIVGGPDVQVARRVHARCLSRYQAIGLLLAFDQPDGSVAKRVGQHNFAAEVRDMADQQRLAIGCVQKELHVMKLVRFPTEGRPLALAAGHPEDELDYVIASDPAHGSLPRSLWHDRAGTDEGAVLIGGNEPSWRGTVADRATRHMVRATSAMAVVCEC
jgi:hypothetical protein